MGEEHFEKGCDFVKLTEVSYETFLRHQNDVEDVLPDKEGGEEDSDLDSYNDENPADVVFVECHFAQHPGELSSAQIAWTFSSFFTDFL